MSIDSLNSIPPTGSVFLVRYRVSKFLNLDLSSFHLLQDLLAQPIKSWRDGESTNSNETSDLSSVLPQQATNQNADAKADPGLDAIHDYLMLKYESSEVQNDDNQPEIKCQWVDKPEMSCQKWVDKPEMNCEEWEDKPEMNGQIPATLSKPEIPISEEDSPVYLLKDDEDAKFDMFFGEIPDKVLCKKPKSKVKFTPDVNVEKPEKTGNFYDFLPKIADLEQTIGLMRNDDINHDLPQHDVDALPPNDSPISDDISAILAVLEEEDKKSRNYKLHNLNSKRF